MMTGNSTLTSVHFSTQHPTLSFTQALEKLSKTVQSLPHGTLVVCPEVALTNFAYDLFEEVADFACTIDETMLTLSVNRTIVLTIIEKHDEQFYNVAKVYHRGHIVHTQAKHKLFTLGEEKRYFTAGSIDGIKLFELDGIKVGILICFELRFTALWERLRGADIIIVPAQWGKVRAMHFQALLQALAIANQCYVVASDSANDDCSNHQAIYAPNGTQHCVLEQTITVPFDKQAITTMRRYINTGI